MSNTYHHLRSNHFLVFSREKPDVNLLEVALCPRSPKYKSVNGLCALKSKQRQCNSAIQVWIHFCSSNKWLKCFVSGLLCQEFSCCIKHNEEILVLKGMKVKKNANLLVLVCTFLILSNTAVNETVAQPLFQIKILPEFNAAAKNRPENERKLGNWAF